MRKPLSVTCVRIATLDARDRPGRMLTALTAIGNPRERPKPRIVIPIKPKITEGDRTTVANPRRDMDANTLAK